MVKAEGRRLDPSDIESIKDEISRRVQLQVVEDIYDNDDDNDDDDDDDLNNDDDNDHDNEDEDGDGDDEEEEE